jgi:hypothetical protein
MRLVGSILAALCIAGCTGTFSYENGTGGGGGGGGGGGAADAGSSASRQMFDSQINPIFNLTRPKGTCSTCHQTGGTGPAFLGASDAVHYDTITTFSPPVITSPTQNSTILIKGDHEGNALCTGTDTPYVGCTSDEVTPMTNWITMEMGG